MKSAVVHHDDQVTVRVLDVDQINHKAIAAVMDGIHAAFGSLDIQPHLFVTIVPGDTIASEDGHGFALYLAGLQMVGVAGLKPENWPDTDEEWLRQLKISTVHECAHYMQELNGRLDGSQANEDEAERLAESLVTEQETRMNRNRS